MVGVGSSTPTAVSAKSGHRDGIQNESGTCRDRVRTPSICLRQITLARVTGRHPLLRVRGCPAGRPGNQPRPRRRVFVRRSRELRDAVVALQRLRRAGGCQPVWCGRFLKEVRKLELAEQGRPVSSREIARAVSVISRVLCDELLKNVPGRNELSR